jgi:DNA-binding NtrC family response regulator
VPEPSRGRNVWLIDRRGYWREPFSRALRDAGYGVVAFDDYALPAKLDELPDLAVIACTAVTAAEIALVKSMADRGHYILALVATLAPRAMRGLFRAGAYDVTDMPVQEKDFVTLVEMALEDSSTCREHQAAALAGL